MKNPKITNSPDLQKLWDEGYEMEVKDGVLYVHSIPYLDANLTVKKGTLTTTLNLSGDITNTPYDHVAQFIGSAPYNANGSAFAQLIGKQPDNVSDTEVTLCTFSSKPPSGNYTDYYEKIKTYDALLSSQARVVDESVTAQTLRVIESQDPEIPFHYTDSNSARAKIHPVSNKLKGLKIGLIGIGGTGSYLLDLISKTVVEQIHAFDGDFLGQHNSFRSPGAPSLETLRERPLKAYYFAEIYSGMHKGIVPHAYKVDASNVHELEGMDFVFVAIDHGASRKLIIDYLIARGIPFIDVGMGVINADDVLLGHVRTTLCTPTKHDHIPLRINFHEGGDNDYSTNIQIAELNALNATMAVIKWKKYYGLYRDSEMEHNSTFVINQGKLLHDDIAV